MALRYMTDHGIFEFSVVSATSHPQSTQVISLGTEILRMFAVYPGMTGTYKITFENGCYIQLDVTLNDYLVSYYYRPDGSDYVFRHGESFRDGRTIVDYFDYCFVDSSADGYFRLERQERGLPMCAL